MKETKPMKTLRIAAGLFLCTTMLASASIIQVDYDRNAVNMLLRNTPLVGGFEWENDWTAGYALGKRRDLISLVQTDFFANKPTDTATLSWDFPLELSNPADVVHVLAVVAYGDTAHPVLYQVTGRNKFQGQVTFNLDGPISQIYLYGNQSVPDNGTTLALLAGALAALLGFKINKTMKGT
jgi:VPDSG-CTERM motif